MNIEERRAIAEAARPVAYLYRSDAGDVELILDCNGEYARRLIELGYTETPLFDRLAALEAERAADKARIAALEALAKRAVRFAENAHSFDWKEDRCLMVGILLASELRTALERTGG